MDYVLAPIASRLRLVAARLMFVRYLAASIGALCIDTATFLFLAQAGMPVPWAAFCGYGAGIMVHWGLSTRFVFLAAAEGPPTHAQRLSFVISAVIGLGITVALVSALTPIGVPPAFAKALAVMVSFVIVYLVRKYVVFGCR